MKSPFCGGAAFPHDIQTGMKTGESPGGLGFDADVSEGHNIVVSIASSQGSNEPPPSGGF